MGLLKKPGDKAAPGAPAKGTVLGGKLEADPGTTTTTTTETAAAPAAMAAAPAAQGAVAVQAPKATAMTLASIKSMDVVSQCENAYTVDWNTLERVQAVQGNFFDLGKNKASMGDTIQMQLLSWQTSWQVSPGSDDPAAKEFVRYSDDGKVTKQGEIIEEYLEELRQQYPKARCDQRCTLVGVLMGSAKDSRLEGELFQIDMSMTSRQNFDRYRITTAYKIGKGLLSPEAAQLITMTAEIASFKERSWTLVHFKPTDGTQDAVEQKAA